MFVIKIYLVAGWSFFIFSLLVMPLSAESTAPIGFDKIVHIFLFGMLGYLLIRLLGDELNLRRYKNVIIANVIVLAYALFLEYLQQFVPGRNPAYADLLAGLAGSLATTAAWFYYGKSKKSRLLLHICCIGCGAAIAEELKKEYALTLFFYNPNIWPGEEYGRRLDEAKKTARRLGLKMIVGEYDHGRWLQAIKGHEQDEEKGERCRICYRLRLEEAAELAKNKNIDNFTTTLSVSPHKDAVVINEIGRSLAVSRSIKFLERDFKKNNGFKNACLFSRRLGLYRQNYCGCEFSQRPTLESGQMIVL
jgi:epoxyqueuosine reductase